MFKIKQKSKSIIYTYTLKGKAGFTIIETIIAFAIFTIVVISCLSIFIKSNTAQKRIANIQRTLTDTRYILEVMAKEIRMGTIDYGYYGDQVISLDPAFMPLTDDETSNRAILALRDEKNSIVRFRRAASSFAGRYVIQYYYNDIWLDITPENINVTHLAFYLGPANNPFVWDSGYASNQQPWVTIVLETQGTDVEGGALTLPRTSHFQTTITSRKYQR